ncbi:alpha/beta hydrolase [Alloiococcus sp. CFN-8]|uniref:alpha/beta hydrolase n=1 Tax=Alloiococcus sp. CFN-8 TaxID=3416081 RepID=UPI003CF53663
MAVMDVNFYSSCLMRNVTYRAIIPFSSGVFPGENEKDREEFKTLYLLHGIMGNYTDWTYLSRAVQLAEKFKIAIIMPSGDNSFYVDNEKNLSFYGEYIGRELVEETRRLLPLSKRREDTFIGGLSMGGYGALRNGLKYSDTFSAVAGLSSAFVIDLAAAPDDPVVPFRKKSYFESIFGDISKLPGSDNDPEALIENILKEEKELPRLFIACGTEDFLLQYNRDFRDFLVDRNVPHIYHESRGGHDWIFWDQYLEKMLRWLKRG